MQGDFTRLTFRREKHYSSVRKQQGRVDLDADWNEQIDIAAHRVETEALDVIGPCGAPKHDAGFGIFSTGSAGDFMIGKGRFYVDGILCQNEEEVAFTGQPDLPGTGKFQDEGRYLIYLDVWQRHLTALDDAEIREVALGGPDTATRTKTIWQVRPLLDIDAAITCADDLASWNELIAPSTGQLSARAKPDEESDKPCIVPPGAGYRRLENQLYRVEIHEAGELGGGSSAPTFKWSRDNASIVAAIQAIASGKITLTTARHDSVLGFAPGQWIEITDDGSDLLAMPGPLVRITHVEDLVLTVDTASVIGTLPSGPLTKADLALHPKVRRWDTAAGVASVAIPSTNDGFIALEDGVEVKFAAGSYRTGDYWLVPARTDKGTVEWPQDESSSPSVPKLQPPHGIQHHFCRLAIIEVDGQGEVSVIEDCRRLFPPLTEIDDCCGCCTKTVGETDAADYHSIQEAINSLPDTGGHICVLAGEYTENIQIVNRRNITISGCGERTRISSDRAVEEKSGEPVIRITNSINIRIETLSLIADQLGNGVLVEGNVPIDNVDSPTFEHEAYRAEPAQDIRLTQLAITAALRSAIKVHDAEQVIICQCKIEMTDLNGSAPGVFLQADDSVIERNTITLAPSKGRDIARDFERVGHGVSGIQIGGGARQVRVLENLIKDVSGQGITLGSLEDTDEKGGDRKPVVGWPRNPDDPCDDCQPASTRIRAIYILMLNKQKRRLSAPASLTDIHLARNCILGTGLDGIGVIGFFDLSEADEFITVRGLTILGNEIRDCLRLAPAPIEPPMKDSMGYGGIALADVSELVVHDNVIAENGVRHSQPVCGIFVLHGQGIDLGRNRLLNNGGQARASSSDTANVIPSEGRRGGIQIVYALAPVAAPVSQGKENLTFSAPFGLSEPTGFPALKVHDNIVSSPAGPALSAVALGPVSVVGNQLTTGGLIESGRSFVFAPATVFIFNLGISNEAYFQQSLFAKIGQEPPPPTRGFDDFRVGGRLANGNVLFADNQCSLDLLETGKSGVFTSLALASLDDIGFQDNQCDCNLGLRQDFVVAHAFLLSPSLRVTGNRFKEGLFQAGYSAITAGLLNTTTHNQATHCLLVKGPLALTHNAPNTVLIEALLPGHCGRELSSTLTNLAAIRNA